MLVTCSYREKEFVRVGYYVNNEYTEEFDEEVGPPKPLDMNKVRRSVLAEKPRVTRFPIQWGDNKIEEEIENVQQNGQQGGIIMEGQAMAMEEAKMAGANGAAGAVGEDSMMVDAVME